LHVSFIGFKVFISIHYVVLYVFGKFGMKYSSHCRVNYLPLDGLQILHSVII